MVENRRSGGSIEQTRDRLIPDKRELPELASRPLIAVRLQPLGQTVQAFGDVIAGTQSERDLSFVHLDAGDNLLIPGNRR